LLRRAAATLFGVILATDLRLLGLGRALPPDAVLRLTLPWAWAGFALPVATGRCGSRPIRWSSRRQFVFSHQARAAAGSPA
jgi:hypothetical protein